MAIALAFSSAFVWLGFQLVTIEQLPAIDVRESGGETSAEELRTEIGVAVDVGSNILLMWVVIFGPILLWFAGSILITRFLFRALYKPADFQDEYHAEESQADTSGVFWLTQFIVFSGLGLYFWLV